MPYVIDSLEGSQCEIVVTRFDEIRTEVFPPLLVDMVAVGEQTGKIDHFEEHYDTLTRAQYSYAYQADEADRTFNPDTRVIS